jgi:hypothetical protein
MMRARRSTRVGFRTNLAENIQKYVADDDQRANASNQGEAQAQALAEAKTNEAIGYEHEKEGAKCNCANRSQRLAPTAEPYTCPQGAHWFRDDVPTQLDDSLAKWRRRKKVGSLNVRAALRVEEAPAQLLSQRDAELNRPGSALKLCSGRHPQAYPLHFTRTGCVLRPEFYLDVAAATLVEKEPRGALRHVPIGLKNATSHRSGYVARVAVVATDLVLDTHAASSARITQR